MCHVLFGTLQKISYFSSCHTEEFLFYALKEEKEVTEVTSVKGTVYKKGPAGTVAWKAEAHKREGHFRQIQKGFYQPGVILL